MYESSYADPGPFFGAFATAFIALFAVLYLFCAYAQYRIAKKCGLDDRAWWGFVPVLNLFLWIECARREWYWFIFMLIPFVNIVAWLILAVDICKNIGQSPVWGVLTILPFINLVAIGVMAFSAPVRTFASPGPAHRRTPVGV